MTRFLTKPWEAESSRVRGHKRYLRYFDFDTETFQEGPSKTLFAEDSLNAPEVEAWLNLNIESPLGACRERIAAGVPGALEDWKIYRAATLMLWLQGVRTKAVSNRESREELGRLAARPMDQTDALVLLFREEYDLCIVTTDHVVPPLTVSSIGFFPIVYPDSGCLSGNAVGFALSIAPRSAIAAVPVERHGVRRLDRLPATLARLSIGTSKARRVVVLPSLLDDAGEGAVRKYLLEARRGNDSLVENVSAAKEIVVQSFSVIGLVPDYDHADRIIPPGPIAARSAYT